MTDEVQITIAAQACILLLAREHAYDAGLRSRRETASHLSDADTKTGTPGHIFIQQLK
jgi:hypothetical protein